MLRGRRPINRESAFSFWGGDPGTNNGIARDDTEKHGVTKLCEL